MGFTPGGSVVILSDSWPGGLSSIPKGGKLSFRHIFTSPLQKHVRKVVGGFGKKKLCQYWSEKARKHMCVTDCHDMTLAVKVALNSNTTNIIRALLVGYVSACVLQ